MSSFYGQGVGFPLTLDVKGRILESSGLPNIRQSVMIILGTQHGERVMRPTFGSNLRSLVFAPNNQQTAALARQYVLDSLQQWEPRITVQSVSVTNQLQRPQLLIDIRYVVKSSLDPHAMIYPFDLEQA